MTASNTQPAAPAVVQANRCVAIVLPDMPADAHDLADRLIETINGYSGSNHGTTYRALLEALRGVHTAVLEAANRLPPGGVE